MSRKKRRAKLSRRETKSRKPKSRSTIILTLAGLMLVGLAAGIVISNGWSPFARIVESQNKEGDLPPLSDRGKSIRGIHDMDNIPKNVYGRPLPKDQPQPDIIVKPANRSLGMVGRRDVLNLKYIVINDGNRDLVINNMVTSCGCTTGKLSHNIIPPGHRADLSVRFDVGFHKVKRGERVVRIVWLRTNDPDTPVAEARLTATIR